MKEEGAITEELPLLTCADVVVFPETNKELRLPRESLALGSPLTPDGVVALFVELDGLPTNDLTPSLGPIGTVVRIKTVKETPEGVTLAVTGLRRVRLVHLVGTKPHQTGKVAELKDDEPDAAAFALAARLRLLVVGSLQPQQDFREKVAALIQELAPSAFANLVTSNAEVSLTTARWFLQELNPTVRLAWLVNELEAQGALKRFQARSHDSRVSQVIATAARLERAWVLDAPISVNDALARVEGQVTPFNSREAMRYGGRFVPSNTTQLLFVPGRELQPRTFTHRLELLLEVTALTSTTTRVSARFTGGSNWWLPAALMLGAMGVMLASPFATSFGELAALFVILSGTTWFPLRSVNAHRLNRFVESDRTAAIEWLKGAQLGPYRTHPVGSQRTTSPA